MEVYIRKYFWVVGVLVVMTCSVLAAKAVNHYVEGQYLGDRSKAPKVHVPKSIGATRTAKTATKTGEPLAKRNIFCSECLPVEPEPDKNDGGDANTVPLTSLPLRLVATNVANKATYSFATIRNTSSKKQGAYWVKDMIPEAGKVEAIGGKNVVFRNSQTKKLERIALLGKDVKAPKAAEPTKRTGRKKSGLMAELEAGIKKIDATHYEIDRGVVNKVLANPMAVARGARIVPSIKNGKSNGFKLYAIRPSSVYSKIGLMNGDTLHAVNGFDLTTADKALEVYQKVKESSNLSVSVTRRGKPVSLSYSIR